MFQRQLPIYRQLQERLCIQLHVPPDAYAIRYNIDFCLPVGDSYIGLDLRSEALEHAPQAASKWRGVYADSHEAFRKRFGGAVYVVVSVKQGDRKVIHNRDVIDDIRQEIERLKNDGPL